MNASRHVLFFFPCRQCRRSSSARPLLSLPIHVSVSAEAVQLSSSLAALSVLSERLGVLEAYLTAARCGTVRADRAVLRHIAGVLNTVPIADASGGSSQVHADIAKVRAYRCAFGHLR